MAIKITKDKLADVLKSIHKLVSQDVLIGIPQENDQRKQGPLNNATLGYIHEHGSPANNLPARPFLVPGVTKAEGSAIKQLRKGATAALDGNPSSAEAGLMAAGLLAVTSVKNELQDGNFAPLAPSTIRGRKYGRGTQSTRKSETQYLDLVRGGMDPAAAQTVAGIHPLINTGEMRNAVTYVLRKKK